MPKILLRTNIELGNTTAPASEPKEIKPEKITTIEKARNAIPISVGTSTSNIPTDVFTPLPPLKPAKSGYR